MGDLTASQLEMLRKVDRAHSHGCILPASKDRDALRIAGLILSRPMNVGHRKAWTLTAAGHGEIINREGK